MPLPIQVGQVTQALQRAFGFKGRYTPMLDEVIVPVYVIADPSPAGLTALAIGTGFTVLGAAPGTFAVVFLHNPEGSGVLLNVTAAHVIGSIKLRLQVRFAAQPGATRILDVQFRDRRNRGEPSGQIYRDDTRGSLLGDLVAVLTVDGVLSQTASWVTSESDPRQPLVVLEPGQTVVIQNAESSAATSDGFTVNWRWLEIPLTEVNPPGGLP